MDNTGKKYDIEGTIRTVQRIDENFAYFDGNVTVKRYLLGTKYEEFLDPEDFFKKSNNSLENMANQIKNYNGPLNENHNEGTSVKMTGVIQKPYEDKVVPPVQKYVPQSEQSHTVQKNYNFEEQQRHNQNINNPVQPIFQQENPEEALFKKLKRNYNAKFDLQIEEKIPTIDFIKMMNDNFEMSIIDYLSNQMVNKMLQDPSKLRKQLKDQLETMVYGAPRIEEVEEEIEEERPVVKIVEESVEEIIDEKPTVSVIETSTEETIEEHEKTIVSILENNVEENSNSAAVIEGRNDITTNTEINSTPTVNTIENDHSAE